MGRAPGIGPKLLRHKMGGRPDRAYVNIVEGGRRRRKYFGDWGERTTELAYAEWLSAYLQEKGDPEADLRPLGDNPTLTDATRAFEVFAMESYRNNTSERDLYLALARLVRDRYPNLPAKDFGPRALKRVQEDMVAKGWTRKSINRQVGRVRRMFRWMVSEEVVPASTYQALLTVDPLRQGKTKAKETEARRPVEWDQVEKTIAYMSQPLDDVVRILWLTGARPAEILAMEGTLFDTGGDVWIYRPRSHKTQYRGGDRVIALGPRAQEVIRPWLERSGGGFLFKPADGAQASWDKASDAHLRERLEGKYKHPRYPCTERAKERRAIGRPPAKFREHYDGPALRSAVRRACNKAGIKPAWTPYQLRHAAATRLRAACGAEAAQVVLGHAHLNTTEIYARKDLDAAAEVMRRHG